MKDINKLIKEAQQKQLQAVTRRHFLKECVAGIGGIALGGLLANCGDGRQGNDGAFDLNALNPLIPKSPHFPGKAKSVIYLHMAGAPSQLELFDYKPALHKLHNQPCPESLLAGKKFAFIRGVPKMLGPQATFAQYGQSGAWVSDHLPHFSKVVDEVSFLKAVHTDQFNHGPAQLFMHTGSARLGRPSIGSWVTYGLGSENSNLPGFVVLTSGGKLQMPGRVFGEADFFPLSIKGCSAGRKETLSCILQIRKEWDAI